jgi:hypothetical protein
MTDILADRSVQYDALLEQQGVPPKYHSYFRMWVRYYLAFCRKQGVPAAAMRIKKAVRV